MTLSSDSGMTCASWHTPPRNGFSQRNCEFVRVRFRGQVSVDTVDSAGDTQAAPLS